MLNKSARIPVFAVTIVIIIAAVLIWDLVDSNKVRIKNAPGEDVNSGYVDAQAAYVGKKACINCHQRQGDLWSNSHHDLAMQEVNDSTVLGDFNDATFVHFGITSKFFRRNGNFYVETEGLNGRYQEFEIRYTFGVIPLQQYLVKFPDGRLQVLPLCWDTRPESDGGQRWFHIYPDEKIAPDDILFWMRLNQNWNFMCSECHSTDVKKNYDIETDSYNTTFAEVNVACESCHGPGSEHVTWAEDFKKAGKPLAKGDMGLKIRLKEADKGTWIFRDQEKGTAERNRPLASDVLVEMCARCHARRTAFTDQYVHGRNLLDTHRPQLLEEGLYYPDGQILEEVYVYDSFLQSKMHQRGVICSDCHEPHSTKVYAQDNTLCYRCHSYEKFGARSHHFHNPDSTGSLCVECHMPERTYMVVDPRRDHSIRIPRPDLSERIGTPNACNKCHNDKDARWATNYVKKWYGEKFTEKPHFGEVFDSSRKLIPGSREALIKIINDPVQPVIVKASAILELQRFPDTQVASLLNEMVHSKEPLLRFAAAQASDVIALDQRWTMMKHLLHDSLSVIRLEAAIQLSGTNRSRISDRYRTLLDKGIEDYINSQKFNGERPSSHINLGVLYLQQGQYEQAEMAYKRAIKLEPGLPYSHINLSDLYRAQNRDDLGEKVLLDAIAYIKNNAALYHALGLLYARQKNFDEALQYLRKSMVTAPDIPDYAYTYGIALNSTGNSGQAIQVLEKAHQAHKYNETILVALATITRDNGLFERSENYARELIRLNPGNQGYAGLLNEIQQLKSKGN